MWSLIGMFLCGFFFAFFILCIVMVHRDFEIDDSCPTNEEMEQMCMWYENEYGKDDANE